MGPLAKGQSVPVDAKCATHPAQTPTGRCLSCGKAVCFDCGSMVDGRMLCMDCAAAAATRVEPAPDTGRKKKGLSLGKKK
jgi:hypothetical protein